MRSIIDKEFLEKVHEIQRHNHGKYAFRGQANEEWLLHSAATRRLIEAKYIPAPGAGQITNDQLTRIYKSYHRDELIYPAQTAGFDIEEGSGVSDLQLLATLQHFGAATGLIDFTWNPLIALWFACAEQPQKDGKVFVVNLRDRHNYDEISSEKENIDDLFPTNNGRMLALYREPKVRGGASARVLSQQSVLVLMRSLTLNEGVQEIKIESSVKKEIKKELANLGISELSLFRDIYGFSTVNRWDAPVRQMDEPGAYSLPESQFYLRQGNQFYQQGDYDKAIESYGRCIDIEQNVWELYYLLGNAKAQKRDYKEAIEDYDFAEKIIAGPTSYNLNRYKKVSGYAHAFNRWWIPFNRGNAQAALNRHEDALKDYNNAVQLARIRQSFEPDAEVIFFNRANTKMILGDYGDAIRDYDKSIRLDRVHRRLWCALLNKGNALVIEGRFREAQQCYHESMLEKDSRAEGNLRGNMQSLELILQGIGEAKIEGHNIEPNPNQFPNQLVRVIVTVNDGSRAPQSFYFNGNVGNTGNFGGIVVPGGSGYPGGAPFEVQVRTGNPPPQPDQPVT